MNTANVMYIEELENAIASVEIEGYSAEQNHKDVCLDFVTGKISKEEFIKIMLERC